MSVPKPPPAIALVPGFLGFEHSGEHTYFADRFVAGLRCALEARGVGSIPVVSVSTLGISGLVDRQNDLLEELALLETPDKNGPRLGKRTWHLLGHSTGGVDAAMLLRESPLTKRGDTTTHADTDWGRFGELVARISSVTTISTPHFGTGLAAAPLARFVSGHPSLAAIPAMFRAASDAFRRDDLGSRIGFALSAAPGATKMPFFLLHMMLMNDLARDLHPEVLEPLSAKPVRASAQGRVLSIATVSPPPPEDHSDKLFRDMWRWTHDGSVATASANVPALPIDNLELRIACQRGISVKFAGIGDNDGVVTSRRQVFGDLIGIVLGDHVDVLGRYRRASLVDGKLIDPGLLTSGAEFEDDEFFELLGLLGQKIAALVKTA